MNVSVIICTRDRPEHLSRCLASISAMSTPPYEVVVVDQSASGYTRKVVETSGLPIRYLHLDCVGHTKARNAGVKLARGAVVAFTDDDCTVHSEWISTIAAEFADPGVSCVCGATLPMDCAHPKECRISTLPLRRRRVLVGLRNPVCAGRGNNMALRRSEILDLGGFNEAIGVGTNIYAGDDVDLFYRLLLAGRSIVQTPYALVYHAQPDDWEGVVHKKRGYAISVSALFACRAGQGDIFAGALLLGKLAYEALWLLTGGLLRMNRQVARIGWHSLAGTLSGLKHLTNPHLRAEAARLATQARSAPYEFRRRIAGGRDRTAPHPP
ncbi:MAG: glycosyltransferase family 2 protein [Armatimonadota bacterium]